MRHIARNSICILLELSMAALAGTEAARVRPIVGAIRWDAWHGEQGTPGLAVQRSLAPRQWHTRLPFFAKVLGDGQVSIDGSAQAVMDQEIAYAASAGLDYWAFVTYPPESSMSLGLKRYLASTKRRLIRFCLITECSRWRDPKYVGRLATLMAEPGYLLVLDRRPVLYLGFIQDAKLQAHWGGAGGFRRTIDGLRAAARKKGLANPYIVVMDPNPQRGKSWLEKLGCDAISSYAVQGGAREAPYAALAQYAERFWERCAATGAHTVPTVMAGWDRRPRVARPVPWEKWQKPGVGMDKYYEAPTPKELAAHLQRAVRWLQSHPTQAPAALAIIYAWNENDEGGWLVPTLAEGNARLEAIRPILRP